MTAAPRVLITRRLPAGVAAPDSWQVWPGDGPVPRSRLLDAAPTLDGLLCMLTDGIDTEFFEAASNLRVVSQMAAGVDNIDLRAATAAGIPVGHTPDVLTDTTADTAFALLAAATRRLPEGQAALRSGGVGAWDPGFLLGGDLSSTTLGIVGMGRIGRALARRAAGFDMELLYAGPRRQEQVEEMHGATLVPLPQVMARSHHVVLAAPLTEDTRHLVDRAALESMRDDAVLVNIARGGLVDHDALVAVASTGRIAAALDVTEPEPLPPEHPLLALPNVLVVPHLGSASRRTRAAMARRAIDNLERGLEGVALVACANPDVYSRVSSLGAGGPGP